MADAFGDDLFSVFDEEASASSSSKSAKPGPPARGGPAARGKRGGKAPAAAPAIKREASSIDGPEECILGKKLKLDSSAADELNLADLMPRLKIQEVETVEGCTHEVALPADDEYVPLKPRVGKAAKEYPFILDAFQREAILCIDNNQSVLVSAHTSAGKTVCAEYAIALALREKQRVIFTSPIKALSNQKYREMYEEFNDVGLMTGDVTINPTASCLVMTTEILRSMLYRGSEVMREVAWVIFDEIHYMRDSERGVVWEETIILLPDNVHYVFLSATIPNARQFAEWICHLHKQACHVVYTDYRPTPLQHYIFPAGGDGLHLVVDENGDFREDNFNTAMQVIRDAGEAGKGDQRGRKGGTKGPSNVFKIVKMIMERNFQPVIIFSFSKKECEAYALQMSKLDFNSDDEKKMVEEVFNNAIDCLSDEDKKLPQVEHVLPLLKRGIGIHHGGLLPILKETIEILFSEGLLKALFATETFAMGINMPARTVLFTSARKFDGKDFRWISSGEYIQMSGRAGRRGMDERGIVILMVDEKMSPTVGKQLLKGIPPITTQATLRRKRKVACKVSPRAQRSLPVMRRRGGVAHCADQDVAGPSKAPRSPKTKGKVLKKRRLLAHKLKVMRGLDSVMKTSRTKYNAKRKKHQREELILGHADHTGSMTSAMGDDAEMQSQQDNGQKDDAETVINPPAIVRPLGYSQVCQSANEGPTLKDVLTAITTCNNSVTQISDHVAGVKDEVSLICHGLQKITERTAILEDRVSVVEDNIIPLTEDVGRVMQTSASCLARIDELENQMRRNNVRIVGLPEKVEGSNLVEFIEQWLCESLGKDKLSPFFSVEHAARVPSRPPLPGAPPRQILLKLLHYKDKETLLKHARELQNLTFNGAKIAIFPDFSQEIHCKRLRFNTVKQRLRALNVQCGLVDPAKLRVHAYGKTFFFNNPEEASNCLDHNQNCLQTRLA